MGIASLEDKIVQQAVVTILNQIYEVDFRGFSYGFRPGRDPHQALDALNVGIARRRVNWILDADIKGFFDHVSHEWLEKFLKHRIADSRVLRLIQKWMKAGVLEDGERLETEQGTPQGAVISPLLANVYLHYVFDLWAEVWREKVATGDMIVVRYADDLVVGFQHRADASHHDCHRCGQLAHRPQGQDDCKGSRCFFVRPVRFQTDMPCSMVALGALLPIPTTGQWKPVTSCVLFLPARLHLVNQVLQI